MGLLGLFGLGYADLNVAGDLINTGGISDNGTLSGNVFVGGALQNSGQISVATLNVTGMLTNHAAAYVEVDNGGNAASLSNAGTLAAYNSFGVSGDFPPSAILPPSFWARSI